MTAVARRVAAGGVAGGSWGGRRWRRAAVAGGAAAGGGRRCARCVAGAARWSLRGSTRRRCAAAAFGGCRLRKGWCAAVSGKHKRGSEDGQDRTASSSQHPRISPIWRANLPAGGSPDQPRRRSRPWIAAGLATGQQSSATGDADRHTVPLGPAIVATLAHSTVTGSTQMVRGERQWRPVYFEGIGSIGAGRHRA